MKHFGVVGTGSWGTAIAHHLAMSGQQVTFWGRRPELVESIRQSRDNTAFLPGALLPTSLEMTSDLKDMAATDAVVVVVPSHGFRHVVSQLFQSLPPSDRPRVIISATKGIETETLDRMSEVTAQEAEASGHAVRFAVLAGPSFARELADGAPTVAVMASQDEDLAEELQHAFSHRNLRLYTTQDVVGVEIGGTTKNVIAIAAGVVSGLELGYNTQAALLTRGLHEITRLGVVSGGEPRTFAGLAGMGDLVLTCTGGLSRNRQMGLALAAGQSEKEISSSTPMVAEGVRNSLAVARLAKRLDVEMPITEQMVEILYHGKSPKQAVSDLMNRELRSEAEF